MADAVGELSARAPCVSLDDAHTVRGTAVVIDVLRAFTTAAVALGGGATTVALAADTPHARTLAAANPGWLLMGEEHGLPIPGFDLSNSPYEVSQADVFGQSIIHRSTSGTRAVNLAVQATASVFCASLVCATAVAEAIDGLDVTYVISGLSHDRRSIDDGDDDIAVAEYIEGLRTGNADLSQCMKRIRQSRAAKTLASQGLPLEDIEMSASVDTHPVVMRVGLVDGLLTIGGAHGQ